MIQTEVDGNTVEVKAIDKLTPEDYKNLTPRLEQLLKKHDKLNLYFDMTELGAVTPEVVWRDLKFDVQHLTDFKRVAIVGEAAWQQVLSKLGTMFSSAEVKYFKPEDKALASSWVNQA